MLFLVLLMAVSCAMAQRPMYAGSGPIGRPDLASRFRDPAAATTAATAPGLNNRVGEDTPTANANIPIDALGDEDLVNRLNQWPREHRPFWLINSAAIEEQRNRDVNRLLMNQGQQTQQATLPQGGQQGQQGQQLGTRGSFDDEVPSLPIRPANQKPSFWSSGN